MNVRSTLSATHSSGRKNLHTVLSSRIPLASRTTFGLLLLLLLSALAAQPLSAQYANLYDFANSTGGSSPSLLAEGRDNNIYGVTATGGLHSKGQIFKIGPTGGFTSIYSFDGPHGATPVGGLTLGPDGSLYGTSEFGGANSYGNIFKISPAGVLTVLYDFTSTTGGGYPISPLTLAGDGFFYGTSYPYYAYKISPAGVFHLIGRIPGTTDSSLVQATNGSFYGVTLYGGTNNAGAIYRITGTTITTLHSFDEPTGSYPVGGVVQAWDGNLYGTTTAGGSGNGGVIYRITPAGAYSVVYNFDSVHTAYGYQSNSGLVAGSDGNMYGATVWGGQNGNGVIFKLTTAGAYSLLYSFAVPSGVGAYSTPIQHTNGKIYGMTTRGGAAGTGVVYSYGHALPSYIELVNGRGLVGGTVGIVGRGFSSASSVEFNGTPASFHVISNTFLTATVPSGETGFLTIATGAGNLTSSVPFYVTPQFTGFSPESGKAGDIISITGTGLIQTINITFGGVKVTQYTVNSDSTLTTKVPAGAVSGKIVVKTPGGSAASTTAFTVTQ